MDSNNIDKEVLKSALKEILQEKPELIKEAIREMLASNEGKSSETDVERRKRLEKLLETDFEKYEEVFNALS
ncbi:MAG: hypothetical protein AAF655_23290 [Bacteroidota bacterium]